MPLERFDSGMSLDIRRLSWIHHLGVYLESAFLLSKVNSCWHHLHFQRQIPVNTPLDLPITHSRTNLNSMADASKNNTDGYTALIASNGE
jgi:hypothetical protein